MNRRVILLVLVVSLLGQGFAAPADAALPEGARLAISVFGDGPGAEDEYTEVITTGPGGEDPQTLLHAPGASIGDGLSWSADGNRLAFSDSGVEGTASGSYGTGWPVTAVARLDAQTVKAFPRGFLNAGDPVLSPNGASVVFQRIKLVKELPGRESFLFKSAIWRLDTEGGSVKRLTRWRLAAVIDPISFSPDGSRILAEVLDRSGLRIVAIDPGSARNTRLARLPRDASESTYSSDGTKLAYIRDKTKRFYLPKPDRPISELWVANADGSNARRVLRAMGYISYPSWDPSGSRLAFTRNPPAEATGGLEPEPGNEVMAVNADGTCLTRVISDPDLTLGGAAWRPGPGREAGLIAC